MSWNILSLSDILPVIIFSVLLSKWTNAQFTIEEESPVNTIIGNIGRIIPIANDAEFLLSQDSHFKISTRGDISLGRTLDLETLCRELVKCCSKSKECTLNVIGMEKKTTKSFNFNVRVLDVNDFTPKFPSDPIVLNVAEDSTSGTTFVFDKATDGDFTTSYNQVTYSLNANSNISDYFSLNDQSEPKLTILRQLDFEQVQLLTGTITACDYSQKCSSVQLIINVIDVNDNEPRFQQSNYEISVNEDFPQGNVVEKFIAIDKDSPENGQMNFWFDKTSTDDETLEYFEIERATGKLILIRPLSIKARGFFEFKVAVGEGGKSSNSQQHTDMTHVRITVKDVNDNAPMIREFPVSDTIDENVKRPFLVAFSVSDNDEGENARTRCELISSKDHLQIMENEQPATYKIVQTREFDAESEESIVVDVLCSDHGTPPMTTRKSWKIKVNDRNEFKPKMDRNRYSVDVPENLPRGTHIIKVSASDSDRDSDLVFALDTIGQQFFTIDAQTGEIQALGGDQSPLDFEQMANVTFVVSATDYQDDKNYQTTAEVTVNLIDVNDNTPSIEVLEPFRIHENTNGRTRINGKIIAEDLDQGANGKVHFKMENAWDSHGKPFNDRVSIDDEGNLYALSLIDREEVGEITVSLVACDEGASLPNGRSFCCPAKNITIQIIDENDNGPKWIYPQPEKKEALNLTTDYPAGSHVTFLRAVDPDFEDNGRLNYELIDPLKQTVFTVNSSTGELLVNPNATSQNPLLAGRYELHLRVSDNGTPPKVASSNLIISVATSEAMVNAQINFYIIIIMIILTSVISVCLIIAIICVRRKPKNGLLQSVTDGSRRCHPNGNLGVHCHPYASTRGDPQAVSTAATFYSGNQMCYPIDGQKSSIYNHEASPTSGLIDYDNQYGQIYYPNGTITSSAYNPHGQQHSVLLASSTSQLKHGTSLGDVNNNHGSLTRTSTPNDENLMTVGGQQQMSLIDGTMVSTFGHPHLSQHRSDAVCISSGYRQISPGTLLFSTSGPMTNSHSPIGPLHIVDHVDGDSADSGRGASEDDHNNQLQQQQQQQHNLLSGHNQATVNSQQMMMAIRSNSPSQSIGTNNSSIRYMPSHHHGQAHFYKFSSMNKNSMLRQYPDSQSNQFEEPDLHQGYTKLHPTILTSPNDIMKEDRV